MNIEMRQLDSLVPYENNPRVNDGAVAAVVASIREFGFRVPLVIDEQGVIVCGHTRYKAAKKLGLTEVPCHVATDLTPDQLRAYRIADNKSAEIAEWDVERLTLELTQLADVDFDMSTLGFTEDEINGLVDGGTDGETDPDAVPEPPVEPITQPGDLWLLGDHRLLCGDSTKAEDVAKLLDGRKPFIMATDPPYGVELDQSWRDAALGDKAMGPGNKNTVASDDRADWSEAWELFLGDVAYVWHAGKYSDVVMNSLRKSGFSICQQLVWNKTIMVMGRSDYHFKHEPCWYAVRNGQTHGWIGDRKQTTIIEAASPNHIMAGSDEEKTDHPTQKPAACFRMIANHGGDVYDPFCGSGTTIIAAEQLGRRCYAIEINPTYVDVSVKRREEFTGRKAERQAQPD